MEKVNSEIGGKVGSPAVGGWDSILVPIVSLAISDQGLRDDVPGSVVGVGEGMRELERGRR